MSCSGSACTPAAPAPACSVTTRALSSSAAAAAVSRSPSDVHRYLALPAAGTSAAVLVSRVNVSTLVVTSLTATACNMSWWMSWDPEAPLLKARMAWIHQSLMLFVMGLQDVVWRWQMSLRTVKKMSKLVLGKVLSGPSWVMELTRRRTPLLSMLWVFHI